MRLAVSVTLCGMFGAVAPAYAAEELMRNAQQLVQALPKEPPKLEGNPITSEKVEI